MVQCSNKKFDKKQSFSQLLHAGLSLLNRRERIKAVALAFLMVIVNWLTAVSILAIPVVIGLIVQPDFLNSNKWLMIFYGKIGSLPLSDFVVILTFMAILFSLVGAAGEWLLVYLIEHFGVSCQNRMANQLINKCVSAPYSWFLTQNSASLSRFLYDDIAMWNRNFVQRCLTIIDNLIQVIFVTIVVLGTISWIGIFSVFAVAAIAYLGLLLTRPAITRFSIEKRNALDSTMLSATQVLSGIRDVKLSSREDYFIDEFTKSYAVTTNTHKLLNVIQNTPSIFLKLVGQVGLIGVVGIMWRGGSSSSDIAMQIGILYLVIVKCVPAASKMSSQLSSLWNAAPYIPAIHYFIKSIDESIHRENLHSEDAKPPIGNWGVISLVGVGFRYPNSSDSALKNINLKIERGNAYAIVGRSAAGKSTLVDLLVALLPPSEGQIYIDNHPIEYFSGRSWRTRIGYVSQSPYISDDTLRANVAFGIDSRKVDDLRVLECLRLANLEDLPSQLKFGLDTRLGERGIRLSGGQRQRIAIARALYDRPEILVFDEATNSLDTISEREIIVALEKLRQHMTLIMIAHRLTTVINCDSIFLLDDGFLIAQGTYNELKISQVLFNQMAM